MITLAITNISTHPIANQDPTGYFHFNYALEPSGTLTATVETGLYEALKPTLDALVTASLITYTAVEASDSPASALNDAMVIKTKYLHALINGVHMEADLEGVVSLTPLAGGALQSAANARANALKTAMIAHMAGVGTVFVDGEHLAADTGNSATLAAIAAATDLPTCITLINGLSDASIAHGDESGVHFHDDMTEAGASITNDPPTTLAHCITDLNDLRQIFLDHFDLGSV